MEGTLNNKDPPSSITLVISILQSYPFLERTLKCDSVPQPIYLDGPPTEIYLKGFCSRRTLRFRYPAL